MDNSNLTERAEEIIKLAAQGLPMQGKTKPFDELLYYQAKELYGLFAKGMIEKQTGAERRQKITRAYIGNCKQEKLWADQNRQTAALFKGIEAAGTAYAKNRTLDNADSLYYALYHIRPSVGGKMTEKDIDQMIADNEKLVMYTISRFFPTYLYDDDIRQLGYIGLWKACEKYDASLNTKFGSYAVKAIRGEIIKYLRSLQMQMRCPKVPNMSLSEPMYDGDESLEDHISAGTLDWIDAEGFYNALTDRQKLIVRRRIINKASYQEIGDEIGISRERVRQEVVRIKQKFDEYI